MPFLGKTPTKLLDANVNIDGGNIDGTTIGSSSAAAGTFTNLTATGTLTLPDDGISGDDINGGTISNFASTGIDDNATSTAITIDSSENTFFSSANTHAASVNVASFANTTTGEPVAIAFGAVADNGGAGNEGGIYFDAGADGSAADNQLQFNADHQSSITPDMVITGSGNVGIGTTSPSTKLTVSGSDTLGIIYNGTSNAYIRANAGGAGQAGLSLGINGTQQGVITYDPSDEMKITSSTSLRFITNLAERMRIDSSGNVGIGTSSPSELLHIANANDAIVLVESTGSDATDDANIQLKTTNGTFTLQNDRSIGTTGALTIAGATSNNIVVDHTSGNVGIGTASPSSNLHVQVGAGQTATLNLNNSDGNGTVSQINLGYTADPDHGNIKYTGNITFSNAGNTERMRIDSSGNLGLGTNVPSSYGGGFVVDDLGINILTASSSAPGTNKLSWWSDSNGTSQNAYISVVNDGATTNTGEMVFYTKNASATLAERMRIDASGNLLVGTTTTVGTGTEGVQIATNGSIITGRNQTSDQIHHIFKNPNGTVGTIRTLNNATSYVTSSDQRLKENIVDAPAGNIDAIRVRSFDWKADGTHQTYGMVAQELVDVAPEAVSQGQTEDDMWGVDYSKLVPMMIKEIQDLRARVAQLEGA